MTNFSISSREQEILTLLAYEYSTNEIAEKLLISHHTVISHRQNLKYKLDVRNTAGLIRRGFEIGYLSLQSL